MRRIKSLHEPCPLHHARRSAAADHIDVISLRLVLGENPSRDIFRIASEKIDLYEMVFLFKTIFQWAHHLIDYQSRVESDFAFFLGAFDENFLALSRLQQGDIFDACAPG